MTMTPKEKEQEEQQKNQYQVLTDSGKDAVNAEIDDDVYDGSRMQVSGDGKSATDYGVVAPTANVTVNANANANANENTNSQVTPAPAVITKNADEDDSYTMQMGDTTVTGSKQDVEDIKSSQEKAYEKRKQTPATEVKKITPEAVNNKEATLEQLIDAGKKADYNEMMGAGYSPLEIKAMEYLDETPEETAAYQAKEKQLQDILDELDKMKKPETPEEREKREKLEKQDKMWASIGDGISALSNLFFTTKGAPNMYDADKSMTDSTRRRYEQLKKERDADNDKYYNAQMQKLKALE